MDQEQDKVPETSDQGIISLLRDVGQFQIKLIADGLRDLLLSPVSILLALAGMLTRPDDPGWLFRRLMRFGVRTDRWINLFGAHHPMDPDQATSDQLLRSVEARVIEEWKRTREAPHDDRQDPPIRRD